MGEAVRMEAQGSGPEAEARDVAIDVVCEAPDWEAAGLGALAERACGAVLARHEIGGEVAVLGCDDARIAALNAGFRGRDRATNVLAWPSAERGAVEAGARPDPPAEAELGDVAIAWGVTRDEAAAAGIPVQDHATHLLVHATLHLLGYDHDRDGDAAAMEAMEVEILASLGLPDPYRQGGPRVPDAGQGPMGDSADQRAADDGGARDPASAPAADEPERSGGAGDGAERGFFGRIIDAFGGGEGGGEAAPVAPPNGNGRLPPGLMNLRRMRVEDVAIPTVEIEAVPLTIDAEALLARFRDTGLTRLPVYDGTLDTPRGMVHLKDFALRHGFGAGDASFDLAGMIRPLLYAPPSMPIGVLLQKMQSDRMHMALVIDEYGGVDGLVTIEDLIEQVIGEIADEHDTEEDQPWIEERPGVYLAQAKAPLDAFEDAIGMRLVDPAEDEEIDTLGGVVFLLTGRVPARGEVIPHPDGAEIEIVDADPRRIKRLRVRLPGAAGG